MRPASIAALVTICISASTGAQAGAQSTARPMEFDRCLQLIRSTAGKLGVAPINIVETNDLRMVRFVTADGSVLVTCSRPDRKMVLTRSDKKR